jgi:hypothetical protein
VADVVVVADVTLLFSETLIRCGKIFSSLFYSWDQ